MNSSHRFDTKVIPKELQLILNCLNENKQICNDLITNVDWNLFMEYAIHHRLYPILYKHLNTNTVVEIPPLIFSNLKELYKRNIFQMMNFSAMLKQVNALFTENKIQILFLKGPTLGYDLYGDISCRTSNDIDVLIPIDKLNDAEQILLDNGFEKDDYIKTVLNDWKWRHHHITYYHPEKGVKLEVHWRLQPGPGKEPSFDELWDRKGSSKLIKDHVYTLGNEDLLLYLATHGARHGWSRLRWLHDIHKLLNKEINWSTVYEIAKKNHSLHIVGQCMILLSQLFNQRIPLVVENTFINLKSKKIANKVTFYLESMINLHTNPVPEEVSRYHQSYLFSLMSIEQKILFIFSFLYPYPEDAETLYLPKQLHFLYFPLRPFLWTWRKTRKHALS